MVAEVGIIWGEEQNQPEGHKEHGCRRGEGQKLEGSVMACIPEMSHQNPCVCMLTSKFIITIHNHKHACKFKIPYI